MTCPQGMGSAVVIPLAAEIDLTNGERAYDRLYAAFASGAGVVIADFTATWFCDCAALRHLLTVQRRIVAQGGQLRLVIPSGSLVRRVAVLTGLDGQLHIYPPCARPRPGSSGRPNRVRRADHEPGRARRRVR